MSITRRTALSTLLGATATAVVPRRARARALVKSDAESKSMLYDAVRCIGCRQCVLGCAEENGWDEKLALAANPQLSAQALTVMRERTHGDKDSFLKVQCMHCLEPPCVSACMLGAMHKDADGAVTWNGDLCVGCRYCEVSCQFGVPRFEWNTATPSIKKCQLCPDRRAQGLPPACVAQCRRGALMYGTRTGMLQEAHRRIAEKPAEYNPKVYGEHDGGGTGVLYLQRAGFTFAQMGLPNLPGESVAVLPESIQHGLYRYFAAPIALFAALGLIVRRNTKKLHEEEAAHHSSEVTVPVGGSLLTPSSSLFLLLSIIAFATIAWRYAVGLGASTNLSDGYPFGLWIAFDVVVGTALACGGYAVALLVYVANRGKYHPLVRPALVTSAFGYSLGGFSVLVDIGRPWNFYRIPLFFWNWNFSSILLEVALCIMLYTCVLWIELTPAFLEGFQYSDRPLLKKLATVLTPKIEKVLPYFIALGMLLPTMHQSSLGSLMLMAGIKLHPLWHTPLLPLLFLVSCIGMGYAIVTLECCISSRVFNRPRETPMLRALTVPIAIVLLLYAALRMGDIIYRGKLGYITRMDGHSILFLCEMAAFIVPAIGMLVHRGSAGPVHLAGNAVLIVLGGATYRFSTYLFAYHPGPQWHYFPSVWEFAVTIGLVATEVFGYIVLVKRFPILRGAPGEAPRPRHMQRREQIHVA